jgi:nucleoside-diphosphate-sugar epimerase
MNLLTGATGLLGSHIAEALTERGEQVRALVRPRSDVAFLRQLGVELVEGDLLQPASLAKAVAGADIVYHCAARVGNWGTRKQFHTDIVETTRNLLEACAAAGVGRVLYVSSLSVYGHPREPGSGWMTEDEPFCQRLGIFDHYCRAKAEAEGLAREYRRDITIVRPSWIYGPRDRNGFPRLVHALRDRWVSIVGSGVNPLNIVYVTDVADGVIRAANSAQARGCVYHLASEGEISQQQFFDFLTDGLGLPRIHKHVSPRLAWIGGLLGEFIARGLRWQRSPHVTCYGMSLLTRSSKFSIARAKTELGWQPRVNPQDGLKRTLEWYLGKH